MRSKKNLFVAILFACFSSSVYAVVNWSGGDITADVSDDDITLSNTNYVCADIQVSAVTRDIAMTVNADAQLVGKVTSGDPRLALFVDNGHSITIHVNHDLSFSGAATAPLVVTTYGSGKVSFIIEDEKICSMTTTAGMGCYFFVLAGDPENHCSVEIIRANQASGNLVHVLIGEQSMLSFAATDSIDGSQTSQADLTFSPVNSQAQGIRLTIQDGGCLLVQGCNIPVKAQRDLEVADFNFTVPAGAALNCNIAGGNESQYAIMQILNYNEQWPGLFGFGSSTNARYGCIVGPDGAVHVSGNAYIDYVGLANNSCPVSTAKPRNPSAFIMDGIDNEFATPATIAMTAPAGIYFRSGIGSDGSISPDFTVDQARTVTGVGNVLFDVEGVAIISGSGFGCACEIASLQTQPSGGDVVINYDGPLLFPLRTFAHDINGGYLHYNTGCMLVNSSLICDNIDFVHTDENHAVYPCDATLSEPTYVGGEREARPHIVLKGSRVNFNASAAFSGLDIAVVGESFSRCTFFYNGYLLDGGKGRTLMLGSLIGSLACDGSAFDPAAHIVVSQTDDPVAQQLLFMVSANNGSIVEGITGSISGQFSTHILYLGNGSTMTVGTNGVLPPDAPEQTITLDGKYFSIETAPQAVCCAGCSAHAITGAGTVFVDSQGVLNISQGIRANIDAMVIKSGTGSVQLPESQVRFSPRVGISHRTLTLADSSQRVVVASADRFSDYTLNWQDVLPGYTATPQSFVPYAFDAYPPFDCPAVTLANISCLPIVHGVVGQFQVQGSRLGNEAHVMVDGGKIYELVFLDDCGPASVQGAVVVLQNGAYVGLGSRERDRDSLRANLVLGVNGVTLIPNGNARVELNEDIVVNDICHVLAGPDFGFDSTHFDPDFNSEDLRVSVTQTLEFHSDLGKSIIVKSGGALDLTSLTTENKTVAFSGNARLVLEPGAQILMNGCTLLMTDQAKVITHTVP